ncbi:MAG: ABC transporter ATP-binding protein [Saprospiraceae bacterium]
MSEIAIKVENLSKKYTIGKKANGTLRHTIANLFDKSKTKEDFWALDNVSFEVKKGEAIGIIGRNGAGKSTLLKILSKITYPSKGRALLNGSVSSLLEVGTGFHPELTGRENIFLNGSLLGMSKLEIKSKFDEIVVFSGIDQFIDTPVKRYSSGMYVRLAFSVAAHLNTDILLVDEVLAVGDLKFREKCISKMKDISNQTSKSIIFVSHNLASLKQLCEKSILLDNGKIISQGRTADVIERYKNSNLGLEYSDDLKDYRQSHRSQEIIVTNLSAQIINGYAIVSTDLISKQSFKNIILEYHIKDSFGTVITVINSQSLNVTLDINDKMSISLKTDISMLVSGKYFVDLKVKLAVGVSAIDYIENFPLFRKTNYKIDTRLGGFINLDAQMNVE